MLKLLIIFFGGLNFFGAVAQISKKPDAGSPAIQNGGYQTSTLLTSVINKADIVPHDLDASNAQAQFDANATGLADMDNDEVLSDVEEEDDDHDESPANELIDANATNSEDVAMSSAANSKGGKRLKARLVRYRKADCEKKRRPHKGKKMKEGKCHTLHKKHFNSYEFCLGKQKKHKKGKDDDDDDDDDDEEDSPKGCRMIIFFDGKCKNEASSTNAEESCKDIGEEGVDDDDDDDKDDKKLHARDLMVKKGKGPKYKSAKFLCDGVDTSENTTRTETEDDYYVTTSVSSYPIRVADPTGSSSKSYTLSSITATRSTRSATRLSSKSGSGEPTATSAPVDEKDPDDDDDDDDEKEDDDKEDDDKEDDKEDDDEDKETSCTASQTTKTKKHKSKSHKSKTHTKTKKHHSKTQSISATQSAQATSNSSSP
ncbi:hypothetical protein KCU95_g13045, partial [Aureobasidium melanogenum]